jgi:hypothetical protein
MTQSASPQDLQALDAVEATINYAGVVADKPQFVAESAPGQRPPRVSVKRARVRIYDARGLGDRISLDAQGVVIVPLASECADLFDADAVRATYYEEVERLVARATAAVRVVAFDHNIRSAAMAERAQNAAQHPVKFAHNDYTERSGPQRVRDLFPEDAEDLLTRRFAVVNVWKPVTVSAQDVPLAVCDARTIRPEQLVATDLVYSDRTGEIYSLAYSDDHRWLYFRDLQPSEAMLLKCYDSARDERARFTCHAAFDDPTAPADAPARDSIEVRTLAFFDE